MQAEALLTLLGLLGKPVSQPDVLFSALECSGSKAAPGLPWKVTMDGMVLIPQLEGRYNSSQGSILVVCPFLKP
jgi:hypothetical protein